jgi:two-component system nitrate/nitrite response regulator NarL
VSKVRILIIDDHTLFRESIVQALNAEQDFEVVQHCASIEEALKGTSVADVDVALLDFKAGQQSQFDLFYQANGLGLKGRVLILTTGLSGTQGAELLRWGACGIVMKTSSLVALSDGIRRVMSGQIWLEQECLKAILEAASTEDGISDPPNPRFSERECEVLNCILRGSTNKQAAEWLKTSEGSIKSTVQQLFKKTGARNRSQLVRFASELCRTSLNVKNSKRYRVP